MVPSAEQVERFGWRFAPGDMVGVVGGCGVIHCWHLPGVNCVRRWRGTGGPAGARARRPAPDRSGVETWRSGKFMPCRSSRGFQASLMPTWPASQASSCRTPELGHVVAGIDGSGLGLNNELASYRPCRQAVRAREDLRLRPSGSIHSFSTWRCRCRCGATRQPS